MNEDAIRAELNEILDPCSVVAGAPAGLADMGLLRSLSVKEVPGGAAIEVRIGVTEPGCMMGASFAIKARERLESLVSVVAVDVQLDHAADWDPADLSPAYAERLAAARAARLTLGRRAKCPVEAEGDLVQVLAHVRRRIGTRHDEA